MKNLTRFERRGEAPVSRRRFAVRMARVIAVWFLVAGIGLAIGMAGYAYFEQMSAADAFVNAAMILSGMGPVSTLTTTPGKIFAGCYAILSGLVIVVATGFVLAPILHRVLHHFHLETKAGD
jgi:hypothetical protein